MLASGQMIFQKAFGILSLFVSFYSAFASDYPPGYAITRECQIQESFEVCLVNRFQGGFPRIEIKYDGRLIKDPAGAVNIWIQSQNGQTFYKPLNFSPWTKAEVVFNDPKAGKCVAKPYGTPPAVELPPLTGQYAWCLKQVQEFPNSQTLVWETHDASVEERNFVKSFFLTDQMVMAVAAFNEKGEWDSRFGSNFIFRF